MTTLPRFHFSLPLDAEFYAPSVLALLRRTDGLDRVLGPGFGLFTGTPDRLPVSVVTTKKWWGWPAAAMYIRHHSPDSLDTIPE